MTRVQEAREGLGRELREARKGSGYTGTALAELLGWPQSKVSKIETGRQTPTREDILAWTQATGRAGEAERLLARLDVLETMYAEWRRQLGAGTSARQRQSISLEAAAKHIRAFETTVIPGLLQTPDYARHRLAQSIERHGLPNDVDEGVRVRMQRQEVLYRPGKRLHFVLTEAALRYRLCPVEVMAGQLDRLVSLCAMRTVHVGVIGFDAELTESPKHGFWIFDDKRVLVETIGAELTLTQPQEIALYGRVFDKLAATASYGAAARKLITCALDDLTR
ncbi:helix-turn-helix domain-containing protein [Nonomuraea jabiensis]|uniref:Transcriptional regulator with XRE-family HTH domain n=1 Tax=Nonomuraea jabiensis TaxID=882448 RepID=A0A7W9G2V7_9ACTN|nr:helix-turn-helix transcriptional regulator [Nonomuraea jabiensis]MBB5776239.1 transcriptional regulator with XRE-family HTH domain [Nonomuraea jabiensis]